MIKMSNSIQMYKPGLEDIHPYLYVQTKKLTSKHLKQLTLSNRQQQQLWDVVTCITRKVTSIRV